METSLIDNIFAWCLIVAVILLSWLIIRLSLLLDSHQDRLEETLNKIEKSLIEKNDLKNAKDIIIFNYNSHFTFFFVKKNYLICHLNIF